MSAAPPPHVFIATPCYGGLLTHAYVTSLLSAQQVLPAAGITVTVQFLPSESLVQRARNRLVAAFLASEASHLLFIDADLGFEVTDIIRMLAHDLDVLGAPYPAKRLPPALIGNVLIEQRTVDGVVVTGSQTRGEAYLAHDVPTGFLLVKREVFEVMISKMPEIAYVNDIAGAGFGEVHHAFFDCFIDDDRRYLSEDYAFSRRWQFLGGQVWIDSKARLSHWGTHGFTAPSLAEKIAAEAVAAEAAT